MVQGKSVGELGELLSKDEATAVEARFERLVLHT